MTSAMPASGAASTSAPASRTGSRSARRRSTTRSLTTSRGRRSRPAASIRSEAAIDDRRVWRGRVEDGAAMRRPRPSPARRIIRVRMAMGGTGSQLVPIASSERMAPSRVHEGAVSNRASSVIRRLDPSGDSTAMSYSQPGTRPTSRVARALHGSCGSPEEGRDGARRSEAAGRGPGRPSAEGGGGSQARSCGVSSSPSTRAAWLGATIPHGEPQVV